MNVGKMLRCAVAGVNVRAMAILESVGLPAALQGRGQAYASARCSRPSAVVYDGELLRTDIAKLHQPSCSFLPPVKPDN